jgi:DNA-binding MarR family transcriptional regulator
MDATDEVAEQLMAMLRGFKGLHGDVTDRVGLRVEMPAAAVLGVLAERGPSRASTLAELLRLDLSSVSRQVAALEREGWVQRERDPADQRASLLELSPAGRDLLDRLRAARGEALRAVLTDWSPDDLTTFARGLERFALDLATAHGGTACGPALVPTQASTQPQEHA